ncbi:MAG: thioester reductase domain-containing protein, partial [Verrucomicrobiota bacterium]
DVIAIPMLLEDLLAQLRGLGVRLSLDSGTLRCDAPKGALTPILRKQLLEHKEEILALLDSNRTRVGKDAWEADGSLPNEFDRRFEFKKSDLASRPENILLTGATGFLGSHLLNELLRTTSATVYCLVRKDVARILQALEEYGLWDDGFGSRVIPVNGDLAREGLGLGQTALRQLAEKVDLVLHNGAHVHHGLPYGSLRAANVLGTLQMLRFAFDSGASFHFVSSLSVLPPAPIDGQPRFFESDSVEGVPSPKGGYNLTKWVSEKLIEQAAARGLPSVVYRPGPISGHSETGHFNHDDFLHRLMRGYLECGMAPDGSLPLDILPVDFVSRAIVWLGLKPHGDATLRRYHLLHPEPASSDFLFDACRRAGYDITRVPYESWYRELRRIAEVGETRHSLYPLVGLFASRGAMGPREDSETDHGVPFDCRRAMAELKLAPFPLPALDARLFDTYLEAMTTKGEIRT